MDENELDLQDTGDDFDDIDLSDVDLGDDFEETPDDKPSETPEEKEDEPVTPPDETPETRLESDPTFELKYLGEVKSVKKDEVVKLAQQGLDYDRIRTKYDDLKADMEQYAGLDEGVAYLKELASLSGKPVDKFIEDLRVNALVERGWDEASAREKVSFEREKRIESAKLAKADRATKAEAEKEAERKLQFTEFANRFPDVKPDAIPPEVFADMENGKRLADAYELYTAKTGSKALSDKVDALTKEIEALKKNAENSAKTVGSKATDGNQSAVDPYIDDWNKD